jgi:hypothetical protein
MRSLTSFVTGAALIMTAGLFACVPDVDPFDTIVTTAGDGDGDESTGDGDGDGDAGDGDGDAGDGDGDGCAAGNLNDPCSEMCPCSMGLMCNADDGTCQLGGGGDGDGDGDGDSECNSYDPMMCMGGQVLSVMGIEGMFCGCPCTTNADCPMGPPNTMGGCVLSAGGGMTPTNCGLICMSGSMDCPEGSTCKDVPNQPGVGLCTYP